MLCVRADGTIFSHDGDSCPTGTTQYTAGLNTSEVKTGDGKVVPGTADLRPIAGVQYSGAQLTRAPASSVYQAMADFEQLRILNPNAYRRIVNSMREANLISDDVTSSTTIAGVYRTVLEASAATVETGQPQTPEDLISGLEQMGGTTGVEQPSAPTGGAYRGPTSTVDLSSETAAYTLLNTAARDMIGRDLTPAEVKKYTQELNRIEMQSPRVATPAGVGGTVYSGGIDRNEVVRQLISDNPEFAGYQLNHEIMDTILADIDEGQSFMNEWS